MRKGMMRREGGGADRSSDTRAETGQKGTTKVLFHIFYIILI